MTDTQDQTRSKPKRALVGTVRSISGAKTINVVVDRLVKHPMYGKYVRRRGRLAVHDPRGVAAVGDLVEIVPCRRLSKTKSWRLVRVARSSAAAEGDKGSV